MIVLEFVAEVVQELLVLIMMNVVFVMVLGIFMNVDVTISLLAIVIVMEIS